MNKKYKHIVATLAIAVLSAGIIIYAVNNGWLDSTELVSRDWRFYFRGKLDKPKDITIISWDDDSFTQMGLRFQDWTRAYHSQLLDEINKFNPKVIGFDILVDQPQTNQTVENLFSISKQVLPQCSSFIKSYLADADTMFADSIKNTKAPFILDSFMSFQQDERQQSTRYIPPLDLFTDNGAMFGFANVSPDPDSFMRKIPLVIEDEGEIKVSFTLKVVLEYLGIKEKEVKVGKDYVLIRNIKIPTDESHYMLINFRGPERTLEVIPYYQVYQQLVKNKKLFKDKIILMGIYTETVGDVHPVPFTRFTNNKMPGVEVLGNAMYTIINKDFLIPVSTKKEKLIIFMLCVLTVLINYRLGFLKGLFVSLGVVLVYFFIAITKFNAQGLILPMVSPPLGIILAYGGEVIYRALTEEKEKKRIRNVFSRYVTSQVVEEVLNNPEAQSLGGKRKEVTILFSDIRGFTTMSEQLAPEEVVEVLNEYLTAMVRIVFKNQGTLDKFIGDAIMAIWGAPASHPDDALRAVKTAIEMRVKLDELREEWKAKGKKDFNIGIGINTGGVVVGNIGSPERTEYTVIGDSVNLASRLESLNKQYNCRAIISEFTYEKVKDKIQVKPLEAVTVKGKSKPVMIYEVIEGHPPIDLKI